MSGCGCGRRANRGSRVVRTSGDATPGGYMTPSAPPPEPLAVLSADGVEEVPAGARYRVVLNGTVAYFSSHGEAFGWQGEHGGKLRTV